MRYASLGSLKTTLWAVVGRALRTRVFSIGNGIFFYPELHFDSPGCFLYVVTFPNLSVFVLVRCWAAFPGGRENQKGLSLGHISALKWNGINMEVPKEWDLGPWSVDEMNGETRHLSSELTVLLGLFRISPEHLLDFRNTSLSGGSLWWPSLWEPSFFSF